MVSTGYPRQRIHLVTGKVEDTIPGSIAVRIAAGATPTTIGPRDTAGHGS